MVRPKLAQRSFLKWRLPRLELTEEQMTPGAMEYDAGELEGPFAEVRSAVAAAKQKLDSIPEKDFARLMRALDLYASLRARLKAETNLLISTNASLKMYELLVQMELVGAGAADVKAFCDAELPGAFVVAVNHYVRTQRPGVSFDWVASSYMPDAASRSAADSTILGDSYGIYARNRDHWLMGPPPNAQPEKAQPITGDLTDADVVATLADAVRLRFAATRGATLCTGDAGIDVSEDYNRQEELTSLLNAGQILCAVLAMAPGGCLVMKQYTFVTRFSRSLIALMAALFDEFYVTKPLTSRPANSEVYLVGKGFRGISDRLATALLDRLAAYRAAAGTTPCDWSPLLDPALTAPIDRVLLKAARQLHSSQQVAFIEEAARFYAQGLRSIDLRREAEQVQAQWLRDNPIARLRDDAQLPSN
jgi:cap2 methyltransferase